MNIIEGNLVAKNIKVGIVASRFNEFIVTKLLGGALDGLQRHGVLEDDIDVVWVPGAFEIPMFAKKMASNSKYDAIICLGAVIKGDTPHFDYVCQQTSKGILDVSLKEEKPIVFGVLTTDTINQAIERAGTKSGNKGYDAAITAIEIANLSKLI